MPGRFSAATAADIFNNQFDIVNIGGGSHGNLGYDFSKWRERRNSRDSARKIELL
jgi:hypothetical protein